MRSDLCVLCVFFAFFVLLSALCVLTWSYWDAKDAKNAKNWGLFSVRVLLNDDTNAQVCDATGDDKNFYRWLHNNLQMLNLNFAH